MKVQLNMKILITGATSGIGYALVQQYYKERHEVIAIGRNKVILEQLNQCGIETWAIDLTDFNDTQNTFSDIAKKHTYIDVAILNAGNCEYIDCKNFDAQLVKRVMDANVVTMANSIHFSLPLLRNSKNPHLVGVASMVYYLPLPRSEAYGASKAAVNYLLEAMAIDLKNEGICVTVVNPGFVKTPLTDRNDFKMPFLVDANEAAQIIRDGIKKRKIEIHFPLKLTIPMKILSLLPRGIWRILGSLLKK